MPPQHDSPGRPRAAGPPARKRWGQHFLARPETAERIVDAARVSADDVVLEVGPGDGALTRPLAERARRVVAVEIDPLRARALGEELAGDGRVAVLQGDVMDRTFRDWLAQAGHDGPAVLVANLPYNVATRILSAALEQPETIRRAVATVQAEVARRFLAVPGQEGYGYLSVRTAARATGRILFDLPPAAFRPRPKVRSSVLELTPRPPIAEEELSARRPAPGVPRFSGPPQDARQRARLRGDPCALGAGARSPGQDAARPRRGALARGIRRAGATGRNERWRRPLGGP